MAKVWEVACRRRVARNRCHSHSLSTQTLERRHWLEYKTFRTPDFAELDTSKPKFYALDMFPYPRCLFGDCRGNP